MNSAYLFAIAAALAVVSITFWFKINVEKLKENPTMVGKIQTSFFIGVAISETIPLILLVFGFMNIAPASTIEELYVPGIIVILSFVYAAFFVLLQRSVGVPEEAKQTVNTFSAVGLAMANAIPIRCSDCDR